MGKVCIVCEEDVKKNEKAYMVKDDVVIHTIRRLKQAIGIAKNNQLMVHEKCLSKYEEKRKTFEHRLLFAIIFAVLAVVGLNALQILTGMFSIRVFIFSFLLAAFPIILVGLTSYCPQIERRNEKERTRKERKGEKK